MRRPIPAAASAVAAAPPTPPMRVTSTEADLRDLCPSSPNPATPSCHSYTERSSADKGRRVRAFPSRFVIFMSVEPIGLSARHRRDDGDGLPRRDLAVVAGADLVIADGDEQRRVRATVGVQGETSESAAVLPRETHDEIVDAGGLVELDYFGAEAGRDTGLRRVPYGDLHRACSWSSAAPAARIAPSARTNTLSARRRASWRRWVTCSVVTPVALRTWVRRPIMPSQVSSSRALS